MSPAAPAGAESPHALLRALLAVRLWPAWLVYLGSLCCTVAIAALDRFSGPQVQLTPVYLVPVAFMAWSRGAAPGFAMAALDLAVTLALDLDAARASAVASALNGGIRLVMFAVAAFLVAKLRSLVERLAELSLTDTLTRLANSRAAYLELEQEFARARRAPSPTTVLYLDADRFKEVNDRMGHAAGDDVLRRIGGVLAARVRRTDLAARMGGDEFLVLLRQTDEAGARTLSQALHRSLTQEMRSAGYPVTFSVGGVTFDQPPASVDEAVRAVDEAMYRVKNATRDGLRLERWPRGPEQPDARAADDGAR